MGELLALAGAVCVIVSLFLPSYRRATGTLDAWDTFGPAVPLLLAAAVAACVLVVSNLMERTTAVPVAAAVWTFLFGLLAIVAAVIRLLERPDHSCGFYGPPEAAGGAGRGSGDAGSYRDGRSSHIDHHAPTEISTAPASPSQAPEHTPVT